MKKRNFYYCCMDCKKEYPLGYMVLNSTWKEAGFKNVRDGIICLDCFEIRLKRKLKIEDFTEAYINANIRFGYNIGLNK